MVIVLLIPENGNAIRKKEKIRIMGVYRLIFNSFDEIGNLLGEIRKIF
jgi:hypothetical protein